MLLSIPVRRTSRVPAVRAGSQLHGTLFRLYGRGTPSHHQFHRPQVGTDLHHAGHLRRSVLRLLPPVLQHLVWRCLLVVDDYPVHLCGAGRQLRVSEQARQLPWSEDLPDVPRHQRPVRSAALRRCRSDLLRGFQLHHCQREPDRHRTDNTHYQPLGQCFTRTGRTTQPVGACLRTGRHVPGPRLRHPVYHE